MALNLTRQAVVSALSELLARSFRKGPSRNKPASCRTSAAKSCSGAKPPLSQSGSSAEKACKPNCCLVDKRESERVKEQLGDPVPVGISPVSFSFPKKWQICPPLSQSTLLVSSLAALASLAWALLITPQIPMWTRSMKATHRERQRECTVVSLYSRCHYVTLCGYNGSLELNSFLIVSHHSTRLSLHSGSQQILWLWHTLDLFIPSI